MVRKAKLSGPHAPSNSFMAFFNMLCKSPLTSPVRIDLKKRSSLAYMSIRGRQAALCSEDQRAHNMLHPSRTRLRIAAHENIGGKPLWSRRQCATPAERLSWSDVQKWERRVLGFEGLLKPRFFQNWLPHDASLWTCRKRISCGAPQIPPDARVLSLQRAHAMKLEPTWLYLFNASNPLNIINKLCFVGPRP